MFNYFKCMDLLDSITSLYKLSVCRGKQVSKQFKLKIIAILTLLTLLVSVMSKMNVAAETSNP